MTLFARYSTPQTGADVLRRHLVLLLLVTLLTRGVMVLSYPLHGLGVDDNQAAQVDLMDRILAGEPFANMRYNTGYALVMAPVAALTGLFPRLDDRLFLLVQVSLASLIPFLAYDLLRQRRTPRQALGVALLVALDPFGWQWAHRVLPVWFVAFALMLALWLIERGLTWRRRWLWVTLAGLLLGLATLARLNAAVLAALMGVFFFFRTGLLWRERWLGFGLIGVTSGGLLIAYLGLIHLPTTGTLAPSCLANANWLTQLPYKGVPIERDNGPATAEYLRLLSLEPLREITFYAPSYPLWQNPGPWVPEAEREAFLAQEPPDIPDATTTGFPGALYYYLGPCATDALLGQVYWEGVRAHPGRWLAGTLRALGVMLVQDQNGAVFDHWYLARHEAVTWGEPLGWGFRRAVGDGFDGQIVWEPGVWLMSHTFDGWNAFKWLTPLALVLVLWSRNGLAWRAMALLLAMIVLLSLNARPEPRYIAILYPLYPLLIGDGLVSLRALWQRTRPR